MTSSRREPFAVSCPFTRDELEAVFDETNRGVDVDLFSHFFEEETNSRPVCLMCGRLIPMHDVADPQRLAALAAVRGSTTFLQQDPRQANPFGDSSLAKHKQLAASLARARANNNNGNSSSSATAVSVNPPAVFPADPRENARFKRRVGDAGAGCDVLVENAYVWPAFLAMFFCVAASIVLFIVLRDILAGPAVIAPVALLVLALVAAAVPSRRKIVFDRTEQEVRSYSFRLIFFCCGEACSEIVVPFSRIAGVQTMPPPPVTSISAVGDPSLRMPANAVENDAAVVPAGAASSSVRGARSVGVVAPDYDEDAETATKVPEEAVSPDAISGAADTEYKVLLCYVAGVGSNGRDHVQTILLEETRNPVWVERFWVSYLANELGVRIETAEERRARLRAEDKTRSDRARLDRGMRGRWS